MRYDLYMLERHFHLMYCISVSELIIMLFSGMQFVFCIEADYKTKVSAKVAIWSLQQPNTAELLPECRQFMFVLQIIQKQKQRKT